MPEVNLYIVVVGIASIFLLYYNFYIGIFKVNIRINICVSSFSIN